MGAGTDEGSGRTFTYSIRDGDMPVLAVLEAVSQVTGIDVGDLEPLSRVVDPDALNDLVAGPPTRADFYRSSSWAGSVGPRASFEYQGVHVTVAADRVTVDRA